MASQLETAPLRGGPEWQTIPYRIGRMASGRTVLVTGATTPRGRKTCRDLIDRGDRVIIFTEGPERASDIYGPHAMIVTDLGAIGQGTKIHAVHAFKPINNPDQRAKFQRFAAAVREIS